MSLLSDASHSRWAGVVAHICDVCTAVWLGTRLKDQCDKAESRLIDLPGGPPNAQDELRCQHELYCLMQEKSRNGTGTVVTAPFNAVNKVNVAEQNDWRAEMEKAHVQFRRAELPSEYGLVITHYTASDTFANAVYRLYREKQNEEESGPPTEQTTSLINPRVYESGVCPVPLIVPKPDSESEKRADTWCPLNDERNSKVPFLQRLNSALKPLALNVVFVG